MQPPTTTPHATPSSINPTTCPLCEQRAGSFIADHRGLPRHQLRNGYNCECAGRFTVPVEEDLLLRQRDSAHRKTVAQAVRHRWEQGVTVNLDAVTFRRLLLDEATA